MEFGSRTFDGWMRSIERRINSLERRAPAAARAVPTGAALPVGTIIPGAWAAAPLGWALCDGSELPRAGYASALFEAIGTTYGDGDGTTTFNLPDLRGRTPLGAGGGYGLGDTGGAETVTLTSAEMPSHSHGTVAHTHAQDAHSHTSPAHNHGQNVSASPGSGGPGIRLDFAGEGPGSLGYAQGINTSSNAATIDSATATNQSASPATTGTGGGAAHENMPPFVAVSYAVKL